MVSQQYKYYDLFFQQCKKDEYRKNKISCVSFWEIAQGVREQGYVYCVCV